MLKLSMKKPLPTDMQILDLIYEKYYEDFKKFGKDQYSRKSKILIPIDIKSIAEELGVDGDIVFGRLYFYLQERYGYTRNNGSMVSLFIFKSQDEMHLVNFPYLGSVLAGMREENSKFLLATFIAVGSAIISIISLIINWG